MPKNEENVVLAYTTKSLDSIRDIIQSIGAESYIKAMTMQSVKGLEAQNVIIHNFGRFIYKNVKHNNPILYRQLYVLLTRAQERIYLSIDNSAELMEFEKTKQIYDILIDSSNVTASYASNNTSDSKIEQEKKHNLKLSKLKPVLQDVKDGTELVVAASELFIIPQ